MPRYKYKKGGVVGAPYSVIGTPNAGTHTLGNWQSDNAVDLAVPVGTPIYAVADGTIGGRIGDTGKGGRFAGKRLTLVGSGDSFYYAHLSKLAVKAGQRVKKGQLLGYSGEANGVAHLHFARQNGDPSEVLSAFKQQAQQPAPAAQEDTGWTEAQLEKYRENVAQASPDESVPTQAGLEGVPGMEPPGSVSIPYQPKDMASTWNMLASDPFASPETKKIARRLYGLEN